MRLSTFSALRRDLEQLFLSFFLSLFPIGWLSRLLCVSMMVAGEPTVNYQHREDAYLSVKRLHDAERWF
jgi:hypothetical protein